MRPLLIFIDKCVEGHLSMYADQCIFLCDPCAFKSFLLMLADRLLCLLLQVVMVTVMVLMKYEG